MVSFPICFTKRDLATTWHKSPKALDAQIQRRLNKHTLLQLKKGLYITNTKYIYEPDKITLAEYIASKIYHPSYISLEYVLENHKILEPNTPRTITSITTKTKRIFHNFMGDFSYQGIKPSCYFGFEEKMLHGQTKTYFIATKSKALFDYLYLKPEFGINREKQLYEKLFKQSHIQWKNFSEEDFQKFELYVWKSNSFKMMRIRRAIEKYFNKKKFIAWKKRLLG